MYQEPIYDNESWNPDRRAPLSSPGVEVSTGDYILAIDGVDLRAPDNIYRLLDGTANRQTVLTVNNRPSADGARQVKVVPAASEQGLRTRAWVEANRRLVDTLSGGQLAYVYLPNTGQPGYSSFNRYYFAQRTRRARSSTSATTAEARLPTTSSKCCSAISTVTSTMWPETAIRSPARRRASGGQR
jgi:hypothetical protein